MKYYCERSGLLDNEIVISFEDLKEYFYQIYKYFDNKDYFEAATKGIWIKPQWQDEYQAVAPLFAPSPEIFFMINLNNKDSYPVNEYYQDYTKAELFTVIEMLYHNIAVYNYQTNKLEQEEPRKEFLIQINNILRFYDGGYFLETTSGTLAKGGNETLKEMLSEDLSKVLEEDVLGKMRTAVSMYYRFDSNLEAKKKAINILADILEPLREELKNLLHSEHEISKNKHDKLIFDIVNQFNIRHNKADQKKDYEREIWYDWMMQYYSSIIITYFKIKQTIIE